MPYPKGIANPGINLTASVLSPSTSGPAQIGGANAMVSDCLYLEMINNSAAAATRQYGDVVITDVTGCLASTTTTANDEFVLGVVAQENNPPTAVQNGYPMLVAVAGVARVNIGAGTVAARQNLAPSATAAQAAAVTAGTTVVTSGASAAANIGCLFAVALESQAAKDTNNTIRCKLLGGI